MSNAAKNTNDGFAKSNAVATKKSQKTTIAKGKLSGLEKIDSARPIYVASLATSKSDFC